MDRNKADEYFSRHLDSAFWLAQPEANRDAALIMAESDVVAECGIFDPPVDNLFFDRAVCEQAVWLLRNYAKQTEGKIVTSQSLGELSQGFSLITDNMGLAPRASVLIQSFRKTGIGRTATIHRG